MKRLFLFICLFSFFYMQSIFCSGNTSSIVENAIQAFMADKNIPGVAVAVVNEDGGNILCFGVSDGQSNVPVTQDTIFDLASITKVFTSTELALEVERGKVSLSDPVARYLPQLQNGGAINQVTLLQLATHTSSLPRVPPPLRGQKYQREGVMQFLQFWQPNYPIGTHYLYSNLGFGVIGYALENVEQKPYQQLITDDILIPLGMRSTFVYLPLPLFQNYAQGYSIQGQPLADTFQNISAWPAGGALRSTIADMLKFLLANLGIAGPQDILQAMHMAQEGFYKVNDKLEMGLGWHRMNLNGTVIIEKNGGLPGFSSYIGRMANKNIGIVILVNKAKTHVTQIGRDILLRIEQEDQNTR